MKFTVHRKAGDDGWCWRLLQTQTQCIAVVVAAASTPTRAGSSITVITQRQHCQLDSVAN